MTETSAPCQVMTALMQLQWSSGWAIAMEEIMIKDKHQGRGRLEQVRKLAADLGRTMAQYNLVTRNSRNAQTKITTQKAAKVPRSRSQKHLLTKSVRHVTFYYWANED